MGAQYDVGFRLSTSGSAEVVRDVGAVGATFGKVGDITDGIKNKVRDLALGLVGAFTIKELVQTADEMALLDARLRLATKSEREFAEAKAETYRIAQQNNVALEATTTLYNKLADPVRKLGGGVRETSAIVESFSAALRVGGASAAESSAATLQFAQAMASGALRGDEFNSIAEASPRFMRALAESLGVSTGELRQMAEDGKLTADVVGNALVGSIGTLRAEAAKMPDTVGGAMTRLVNDVKLAVGELNTNSGLTLGIAGMVDGVRELVPTIKGELGGAFQAVGDWIERNRESLAEAWDVVKGIIGDVWEVAKAAGRVLGALWEWELQTGVVKTVLESVRLVIALVRDGVELLAGYFAVIGSKILQGVLAPLNLVLKASASIAGVFDEEMASKIRGVAQGIDDFARAGENAGRQVFQRFQEGKTHTAALGAELVSTAAKNAQLKSALDSSGLSAAENSRELQRLSSQASASAGGFTKLAGTVKESEEAKKANSKAAQALQKDLERQGDLLAELSGFNRDYADKVKDLVAVYARGQISLDEFNKAHDTLLSKQPLVVAQTKAAIEAAKEQNKLFDEAFEKLEKKRLGEEAQIKTARTMLEQIEAEAAALKMTTLQRALATAERELERQGIVKGTVAYEAYIEKIRAAILNKETVQQSLDAAKQIEEGWTKFTEGLFGSVADSLMRGAEAGKSAFESLRDTVKGMFNNLVLQPAIRAGGGIALSAAGSAVGSPSMVSAGQSMLSGAGSLSSLASGVGSVYPAVGGYMSSAGAAVSGWMSGTGIGASSATGAGALATNAALAESAVAGGAAAGAGAGGAMSAVMAAAPYIAAVLAIIAIAQATKGETRGGGQYGYGATDVGNFGLNGSQFIQGPSGGQVAGSQVQEAINATIGGINDTLGMLGSQATLAGFQAGIETSDKGRGGVYAGGTLSTGQTFGDAGLGGGRSNYNGTLYETTSAQSLDASTALKNFTDDLAQATIQALQAATDIPKAVQTMLAKVDAEKLTVEQAAEIVATINAWASAINSATAMIEPLGGVFAQVGTLSLDARDQLFQFAGGVEAFLAKTKAYIDAYFTDAERAAITAKEVLARLEAAGISTDLTTKESLRSLVEGTDVSTETGRQQLAVLLDVADEFASISDYLASQGQTLGELAALAPKSDLIAKLTDEGNATQKDASDRLMELGAKTQAVGDSLNAAVTALDTNSDDRNAELVAAVEDLGTRIDRQAADNQVAVATQVSALVNLRKTFEDMSYSGGQGLRVVVIEP